MSCTAAGFSGPIARTIADPTIASVVLAPGTLTLFYVSGLRIGTTSVTFKSQAGGTGQTVIVVRANLTLRHLVAFRQVRVAFVRQAEGRA
jgi:Flp pilus assembly secretin CpaC